MRILVLLALSALATPFPTLAQKPDPYNVPVLVARCFAVDHFLLRYEIHGRLNPFYLRGDFDGDGKMDFAVLIREKRSGKNGVAVCRGGVFAPAILGAGSKFLSGSDVFTFDAWRVYGKRRVVQGADEGPPPRLSGEAILVVWPEKASGIIYWDGKKFAWYQQGD